MSIKVRKLHNIMFEESMFEMVFDCPKCGRKPKHKYIKSIIQGGKITNSFSCCIPGGSSLYGIFVAIDAWNSACSSAIIKTHKSKYIILESK